MVLHNGMIATARWADPDYISDRYYFRPGDIWIGRNPHNFDQAIGYNDKRHMLVCAGTRSGKGRSFVVNNLALWPGSTVTYDPKGELPAMLAPRRNGGDEYCEGMGQDVFVLDPLGHSGVDEKYLAYFDPLAGLDPEDKDGELITWAKRVANSLIEFNDNTESGVWAKRAISLISLIITHVITSDRFIPEKTNLMTVLRLLMEGDEELLQKLKKAYPEQKLDDGMAVLLEDMTHNEACRGWIATDARNTLRQAEKIPKYFESIRGEATEQLDWFKSAGIERSLNGWNDESRRFDPKRLKTDPKGVSVFIVMPIEDLKTYSPWVQTVFTGIFAAMRSVKGEPASGHQVLTVLDEFSSLGYQEYISSSLDNIAGAGMKLAIIVQNFGKLKKLYGDEMESFFTNSGLEIYFGKIGAEAIKYLKEELGETEVVRIAQNKNAAQSQGTNTSEAIAYGTTSSQGGSETNTDSTSQAHSQGQQWNWSKGINWGKSKNWGKSDGKNMGQNYGPHVFWMQGDETGNNEGTSLNNSTGKSHTRGGSKTRGGGKSKQLTETKSKSSAVGSSWNHGESRTETQTHGFSETQQLGQGESETFHKKPLLDAHEINSFLHPLEHEDRDHPAYPGLALVRIQGESPFFVRRSNYDQDSYFENCVSKDPVHGFIPLNEQPLLGYEYTPDHIVTLNLPPLLQQESYTAKALLRPFQWFEMGDDVFALYENDGSATHHKMPFSGKIMKTESHAAEHIITIQSDISFSSSERTALNNSLFAANIKFLEDKRHNSKEAYKSHEEEKERAIAKAQGIQITKLDSQIEQENKKYPYLKKVSEIEFFIGNLSEKYGAGAIVLISLSGGYINGLLTGIILFVCGMMAAMVISVTASNLVELILKKPLEEITRLKLEKHNLINKWEDERMERYSKQKG